VPRAGVEDVIAVPLRRDRRRSDPRGREPARRHVDLPRGRRAGLETVAAHAAVAVENARLVDRLRYDAYHDRLTSLPPAAGSPMRSPRPVKVRAPGEVVAYCCSTWTGCAT